MLYAGGVFPPDLGACLVRAVRRPWLPLLPQQQRPGGRQTRRRMVV
jgi:hypothetical protein